MFRILKRLGGRDSKAEARQAMEAAAQSVVDASSRTQAIDQVTSRIQAHGARNHFGERYMKLARHVAVDTGGPA